MFVRVGVLLMSLISLLWAAPLSVDALKGQVQEAIQATIGDNVDRVMMTFRPLPSSAHWPDVATSLNILVPERPFGLILVPVEWGVKGRKFQLPVQVLVNAFEKVLVSEKAIDRSSSLKDTEVQNNDRDVTVLLAAGKTPLRQKTELLGKRTKSYIKKGEILSLDLIEPIPDILKGQTVILRVTKGAIEVSLPVTALQDGKIGDTIKVKGNKTDMNAIIESQTLVRAER